MESANTAYVGTGGMVFLICMLTYGKPGLGMFSIRISPPLKVIDHRVLSLEDRIYKSMEGNILGKSSEKLFIAALP